MKKLIVHINHECVFTQQEQCSKVTWALPYYFEKYGNVDGTITAYWQRSATLTDDLFIHHNKKDISIWSWEN